MVGAFSVGPGHRFDLRLFRPFLADLSIKKSSIFFPSLNQQAAPRPAQVSPEGPRYFGSTFLPFNALAISCKTKIRFLNYQAQNSC
jgi:hypothetical protein